MKKVLSLLATAVLLLGTVFVASPASAGPVVPNSCFFTSFSATSSPTPLHSAIYTIPSGSSCSDINVKSVQGVFQVQLVPMWVRFYPSSGPSFTSKIVWVTAGSSSLTVLASDVLDGTRFRLETATIDGCTGTLVD